MRRMKIGVFNTVRGGVSRFLPGVSRYGDQMELVDFGCPPTPENLYKVKGCEAILYTPTDKAPEAFWKKLAEYGVKYVVTSSAGYDHFDLKAMKKYGLKGANVPFYSPNAIAEHAVLTVLALLRQYRKQIHKIDHFDYEISDVMGKEIRNQVIGIVGAGRIGYTTMKCLSGFGPKILTYDPYENDKVKELAEYVSLEELYQRSDVIIYHCIYNEANHHMVNRDTIATMKNGVMLVNVARGGLFDIDAVAEAVENGKIGGLGIDVIEGEMALRKTYGEGCPIPVLDRLLTHENVIFTNHTAFYTDEAEKNMIDTAADNLYSYMTTETCQYELVK